MTLLRSLLPAFVLTLTTACGPQSSASSESDEESTRFVDGNASVEHLELEVDAQHVEVAMFFDSLSGCPVVASAFTAELNGHALAVQESGRFGWVTRPACSAGSTCEGTTLSLACVAPRATRSLVLDRALLDAPLELQVGDTRFSYPVSLSALAWQVTPTSDGSLRLNWASPVAPTATSAVLQRTQAPVTELASAFERPSVGEMILPATTMLPRDQVELVTSVVVSAPGAPSVKVMVRQMLAVQ